MIGHQEWLGLGLSIGRASPPAGTPQRLSAGGVAMFLIVLATDYHSSQHAGVNRELHARFSCSGREECAPDAVTLGCALSV